MRHRAIEMAEERHQQRIAAYWAEVRRIEHAPQLVNGNDVRICVYRVMRKKPGTMAGFFPSASAPYGSNE